MLTFVSASDSSHFLSQKQWLGLVADRYPQADVYIFDLGWDINEQTVLPLSPRVRLYQFVYPHYPLWFDIKQQAGQYAWKAQCVRQVARYTAGVLIWSDAGNWIGDLSREIKCAEQYGLYMSGTRGTIAEWTDPRTINALGLTTEQTTHRCRAASLIVFDLDRPEIRQLIEDWADACLVRDIIAPEGTTKRARPVSEGGSGGHRQDQSVINCLVAKMDIDNGMPYDRWGWKIHCDCDNRKRNV